MHKPRISPFVQLFFRFCADHCFVSLFLFGSNARMLSSFLPMCICPFLLFHFLFSPCSFSSLRTLLCAVVVMSARGLEDWKQQGRRKMNRRLRCELCGSSRLGGSTLSHHVTPSLLLLLPALLQGRGLGCWPICIHAHSPKKGIKHYLSLACCEVRGEGREAFILAPPQFLKVCKLPDWADWKMANVRLHLLTCTMMDSAN